MFPEFKHASYVERYDILCRKLMLENLYSYAAVVTSPLYQGVMGFFGDVSQTTSLKNFTTTFASYCAAESARDQ